MKNSKQVFLSQPLRALLEMGKDERIRYEKFYTDIGEVCKQHGYQPYHPAMVTPPGELEGLPARQIYTMNIDAITESELMIAYVGQPSNGVGSEVEYARSHAIPYIILYEKEREEYVSRMMRAELDIRHGQPIAIICPHTLEEIPIQLDKQFNYFKQQLEAPQTSSLNQQKDHIDLLNDYVKKSESSIEVIAKSIGKDKSWLSRLLRRKITKPRERDDILLLCLYGLKMAHEDTNIVLKGFNFKLLFGFPNTKITWRTKKYGD